MFASLFIYFGSFIPFWSFFIVKKNALCHNGIMKILHCADIHLESKLGSLSHNLAITRRSEILQSFCSLVRQAQQNGFGAFIVAGDLFEGNDVAPSTKTALVQAFCDAPDVQFFLLAGNHDQTAFSHDLKKRLPPNVHVLGEDGVNSCVVGDVRFVGADLTSVTTEQLLSIDWKTEYYNVLICHGDKGKSSEYGAIDLDAFYDKPIDYFAMGHIHTFSMERAGRGFAVYSGCLEPRGYDEMGEKGFVRIDTGVLNRDYSVQFMPFSQRQAHGYSVNVSQCADEWQIISLLCDCLEKMNIDAKDMVEFHLIGEISEDCVFTTQKIRAELSNRLFDVKIKDCTKIKLTQQADDGLPSIKKEFLALAQKIEDEEERNAVIKYALNALNGEEVDLL